MAYPTVTVNGVPFETVSGAVVVVQRSASKFNWAWTPGATARHRPKAIIAGPVVSSFLNFFMFPSLKECCWRFATQSGEPTCMTEKISPRDLNTNIAE